MKEGSEGWECWIDRELREGVMEGWRSDTYRHTRPRHTLLLLLCSQGNEKCGDLSTDYFLCITKVTRWSMIV
jgi:hypothetical protein